MLLGGVRYGVWGDKLHGDTLQVSGRGHAGLCSEVWCGMPPSLQGRLETTWNSASPSPEPASRPDEEIK